MILSHILSSVATMWNALCSFFALIRPVFIPLLIALGLGSGLFLMVAGYEIIEFAKEHEDIPEIRQDDLAITIKDVVTLKKRTRIYVGYQVGNRLLVDIVGHSVREIGEGVFILGLSILGISLIVAILWFWMFFRD